MQKNLWQNGKYVEKYNSLYKVNNSEIQKSIKLLRLSKDDVVLDIGCGKGDFLKVISNYVKFCIGVDISHNQIAKAIENLKNKKNIVFYRSDFLHFKPEGFIFTKGFSRKALHHLKDKEKILFFRNIAKYFKKNALFLLEDGIFEFDRRYLKRNWKKLMEDCEKYYGEQWTEKKKDVIYCFKKEFPTDINVWDKALKSGNFKILKYEKITSFYGRILAKKSEV